MQTKWDSCLRPVGTKQPRGCNTRHGTGSPQGQAAATRARSGGTTRARDKRGGLHTEPVTTGPPRGFSETRRVGAGDGRRSAGSKRDNTDPFSVEQSPMIRSTTSLGGGVPLQAAASSVNRLESGSAAGVGDGRWCVRARLGRSTGAVGLV